MYNKIVFQTTHELQALADSIQSDVQELGVDGIDLAQEFVGLKKGKERFF